MILQLLKGYVGLRFGVEFVVELGIQLVLELEILGVKCPQARFNKSIDKLSCSCHKGLLN